MKRTILLLALALTLAGCNTLGLTDAQTLALYRAHAAEPVKDFQYLGNISGWAPLGDTALALYTRPNQAYLLEFYGRCNDLDFAPAISLSSIANRVSARFDSVYVIGGSPGAIRLPCRIDTIRPLDVKALKQAQRELREAKVVEREASKAASQ